MLSALKILLDLHNRSGCVFGKKTAQRNTEKEPLKELILTLKLRFVPKRREASIETLTREEAGDEGRGDTGVHPPLHLCRPTMPTSAKITSSDSSSLVSIPHMGGDIRRPLPEELSGATGFTTPETNKKSMFLYSTVSIIINYVGCSTVPVECALQYILQYPVRCTAQHA